MIGKKNKNAEIARAKAEKEEYPFIVNTDGSSRLKSGIRDVKWEDANALADRLFEKIQQRNNSK